MSDADYIDTRSKKGRGMAKASLALIEAMRNVAEAAQPITGRGVGYKLFTAGLTPSMSTKDMQRVYRLLRLAREEGTIPWEWIVDETRDLERTATWDDPENYAEMVALSYRRDFWNQQPIRCEVWSEKGTVRGVLEPVLEDYAVGFRVMHGFSGATTIYNVAKHDDGRPLIVLYVGDLDPSGCSCRSRICQIGLSGITANTLISGALRSHLIKWPLCHHSQSQTSVKTLDSTGLSPTMEIVAGSLTLWTRMTFENASGAQLNL